MDPTIEVLAKQEPQELEDVNILDVHDEEFAPEEVLMTLTQVSTLVGRDVTTDDDQLD